MQQASFITKYLGGSGPGSNIEWALTYLQAKVHNKFKKHI